MVKILFRWSNTIHLVDVRGSRLLMWHLSQLWCWFMHATELKCHSIDTMAASSGGWSANSLPLRSIAKHMPLMPTTPCTMYFSAAKIADEVGGLDAVVDSVCAYRLSERWPTLQEQQANMHRKRLQIELYCILAVLRKRK